MKITKDNLPLVTQDDDGIRPAGKPDECFYCHQKIGQPHKWECVTITRSVEIDITFRLPFDVPVSWGKEQIEFHWSGQGSNCMSNIIPMMEELGCLCQETIDSELVEDEK